MMTLKAPELYQGEDWLTYRATVARAFETLDRFEEVCHPRQGARNATQDVVAAEIAELCDDLSGDLDAVLADLFPYARGHVPHRWMGLEMRLHLNAMRAAVQGEHLSAVPTDNIRQSTARVRELLRQIDQ